MSGVGGTIESGWNGNEPTHRRTYQEKVDQLHSIVEKLGRARGGG